MELLVELDLGDLRLRTLTLQDEDAALLVEATRAESAPALWGPRPAGPYSLAAARSALQAWDLYHGRQVSFGVLDGRSARCWPGPVAGTPSRWSELAAATWWRCAPGCSTTPAGWWRLRGAGLAEGAGVEVPAS